MRIYKRINVTSELLCEVDVEGRQTAHERSGRKVRYAVPVPDKNLTEYALGIEYNYGGLTCGEPAAVEVNSRLMCAQCYNEQRAEEVEPPLALIQKWGTVLINNSGIMERG